MMRVIIRKHEDGGDGDYDACGYDQEDTDENAEDMKPAAPTKYAYIYIYNRKYLITFMCVVD